MTCYPLHATLSLNALITRALHILLCTRILHVRSRSSGRRDAFRRRPCCRTSRSTRCGGSASRAARVAPGGAGRGRGRFARSGSWRRRTRWRARSGQAGSGAGPRSRSSSPTSRTGRSASARAVVRVSRTSTSNGLSAGFSRTLVAEVRPAGLDVLEVLAQQLDALGAGPFGVHVAGGERGDERESVLRAGDRDVEAAFAAFGQ